MRYSQYFEKPEQYGLQLKPDARYSLLYPLGEEALADLVYNFRDDNPDARYKKVCEPYIQTILMEILSWMSRFRNTSNFPKLCFVDDSKVFDSRFDQSRPVNHSISPLEKEMMDFLEVSQTLDQIKDKFSHVSGKEFNDAFTRLNNKGLLFGEKEKYISLVCPGVSWHRDGYLEMNRFISITTEEAF